MMSVLTRHSRGCCAVPRPSAGLDPRHRARRERLDRLFDAVLECARRAQSTLKEGSRVGYDFKQNRPNVSQETSDPL